MTDPRDTPSRPGVRLVVAAVVVGCLVIAGVVAVYWPRRDDPVAVPRVEEPLPVSEEPTTSAPLTIADEAEVVAGLIMASSGGWAAHITDIEVATVLSRPVIIVATDIGPEQAGLSDEFTSGLSSFTGGLSTADGSPYTYYLQIRSSEGDVIGTVGTTDDRWALDAPAAPADVLTLRSWLDAVYGPGAPHPEVWFGRITDIGGSVDADGNIVVHTDLDPDSLDDQRAAQTIIDAVNSSGATFATGIRVVFGDGAFEWSALLDGVDPYGP